jgi:hypothetical protein
MSATFTWSVVNMAAYPTFESQTDVVFQVAYSCIANQDTYSARTGGVTNVSYTAGSPYTPYDQLTQDQVLGWVFQNIQKDFMEAQLQAEIDKQANPPYVYPPLPWVASTESTPAA